MARHRAVVMTVDELTGVATIRMNLPAKLNAWTPAVYDGLCSAFDRAARDARVRAAVYTGTGAYFSTGGDFVGLMRSAAATSRSTRNGTVASSAKDAASARSAGVPTPSEAETRRSASRDARVCETRRPSGPNAEAARGAEPALDMRGGAGGGAGRARRRARASEEARATRGKRTRVRGTREVPRGGRSGGRWTSRAYSLLVFGESQLVTSATVSPPPLAGLPFVRSFTTRP